MVFVRNVCVCNRQLCVWETIVFARDNCVCGRQLISRETVTFSGDSCILRRQLFSPETVVFVGDSYIFVLRFIFLIWVVRYDRKSYLDEGAFLNPTRQDRKKKWVGT